MVSGVTIVVTSRAGLLHCVMRLAWIRLVQVHVAGGRS